MIIEVVLIFDTEDTDSSEEIMEPELVEEFAEELSNYAGHMMGYQGWQVKEVRPVKEL